MDRKVSNARLSSESLENEIKLTTHNIAFSWQARKNMFLIKQVSGKHSRISKLVFRVKDSGLFSFFLSAEVNNNNDSSVPYAKIVKCL